MPPHVSSTSPRKTVQLCSEPTCSQLAAYRTRSRQSWCHDHITAMLRAGGLEPLEPFTKPTAWRLTRCLACGVEAYYRSSTPSRRTRSGKRRAGPATGDIGRRRTGASRGVCELDTGPATYTSQDDPLGPAQMR